MKVRKLFAVVIAFSAICVGFCSMAAPQEQSATPSAFAYPRLLQEVAILRRQTTAAFAAKDYQLAFDLAEKSLKLFPTDPIVLYNRGCALARLNRQDKAIASLQQAIKNGFRSPQHMKADGDLESLHDHQQWEELLELAGKPPMVPKRIKKTARAIEDGVALVSEDNSVWIARLSQFQVLFRLPDEPAEQGPVINGSDDVAKVLNNWHQAGAAAGLTGILYDNYDRDHSNIDLKRFPQLTRIEYSPAARKEKFGNGLQNVFRFNATVLGNSSTALVGTPFWRSQPRHAYTNPRSILILATQYFGNHLYVYPEHKDYDVGRNGKGGGHGDVFPANTPYVVISQGSSGSDRPFLNAIASTLAAFKPNVRKSLQQNGILMPSIQMILRRNMSSIADDSSYLTGAGTPPVFNGAQLDPIRMIEMANSMDEKTLPPISLLKVVNETEAVPGRDYFDSQQKEKLFTTPAAVARICCSTAKSRRITIDATTSRDVNQLPLKWKWVVLQGDPARIRITPQNNQSSIAEISVDHHERRPIQAGSQMESARVDIGVFVHNGTWYSPPAIVSFYYPDNEQRIYDDAGRIQSVKYTDIGSGGDYVDPVIITPKNWTDSYRYSKSGDLTGWERIRESSKERFTATGALVVETDELDRPVRGKLVRYVRKDRDNLPPILTQVTTDTDVVYSYSSDNDEIGREVILPSNQ